MKKLLIIGLLLMNGHLFAQTQQETEILKLSEKMFKWEVDGKTDSLASLFDEKFMVIGRTGDIQTRSQYLATLRSGNFVHNSVDVEENTATVADNTATIVGKGKFTVTVSGTKITLHLSYIEVFTRRKNGWSLLALHAGILQN